MTPSAQEPNYLPTLDGWRAVAVVGVMIYHGTTSLFYPAGPYPSYEALKIVQVGNRGVDVFFAISGFLICSRLIQEQQKTGRISLKKFYLRRGFRILPPYFVYLAVLGILTAAGVLVVEGREFIGCLLFVRNYVVPLTEHGWYTGHFWSLAVEEHFYLLWPVLLIALGNRRARAGALLLALCVPVWQVVNAQFGWVTVGHVTQRTDTRIDSLLYGCWAALVLSTPAFRDWVGRWLRPWVWTAIALILIGLTRYEPTFDRNIQGFLMPWLIVGTVLNPSWKVSRALELGAVRWVGRLSYSLYIWQQLWMMGSWRVSRPFPLGPLQEFPLSLVCSLICAVLSYYLVEKPAVRLGSRFSRALPEPKRTADRNHETVQTC